MIFMTGFPGFLAIELLNRLYSKDAKTKTICLIQKKFSPLAEKSKRELVGRFSLDPSQIKLIEGDITSPGLGISEQISLDEINEVFHLAAIYDLSVQEPIAKKINEEGTHHVIEFSKSLPGLKAFQYVSTCYVSGKFEGTFKEDDLERNQTFNNYYESTKHEAEKYVRTAMKAGLPAIIYRPAIVVGNSHTGETQKFDGPYYVIQWLLRQGRHAVLPKLNNPEHYTINLVPSDFVLDAISYLHDQPTSVGQTFQLADPSPLSIKEVVEVLAKACERKLIQIPLPKSLAKFAVKNVPGLESFLGIPYSTLDYFTHPTHYDVSHTLKALQGSGIECPPFKKYAKNLVEFMRKNPTLRSHALS